MRSVRLIFKMSQRIWRTRPLAIIEIKLELSQINLFENLKYLNFEWTSSRLFFFCLASAMKYELIFSFLSMK